MWEPIPGLSLRANSLLAESAAMVEFLAGFDNSDWSVVEDVLKDLFLVECRIGDLHLKGEFYG